MAPIPQAWVTSITDDTTFVEALVLAKSLRRVYTTRKIVAIITCKINKEKRSLLEKEFDAVFLVDSESCLTSRMSLDLLVEIYCWKLTIFQTCVYIGSNNLIFKNCDDLFDAQSDQIAAFPDELKHGFESSIYVFKPSLKTFQKIADLAESNGLLSKGDQRQLLNLYWTKWNNLVSFNRKLWENCVMVVPSSAKLQGVLDYDLIKIVIFNAGNNLLGEALDINQLAENNFACSSENLFGSWLDVFHTNNELSSSLLKLGIDIKANTRDRKNGIQAGSIPKNLEPLSFEQMRDGKYNYLEEAIAVIGMSCKFPNANNIEEFWNLLIEERDAITTVPENRLQFGWEDFDMTTKGGFLQSPIDEFDGKFFGISPREASLMDPQQRLVLESSWEALEDAGINPKSLGGSHTGVYIGAWSLGYERLMHENGIGDTLFQRIYMGNSFGPTSARISFQLGLNGPNIATESGCSSSMISIHLACESLRKGDCNLALAGGVNLLVHPFNIDGADHILAPDGYCKTFDEKADGFVRAEGCGVLVLKKYSDAIKDGDRVMALIRGSAISQEGTSTSFGTPTKLSQEIAVQNAIKNAGVCPSEVTYVEAHGTGTAVGDPTEVATIGAVYKQEDRTTPLYIGSVKTNIGHSESAAGVAGCIKVILSLNHGIIPAHKNLETLNPLIDLESIPAEIPLRTIPWKIAEGKKRIGSVSSFGISGSNVHMIIQEPFITNKNGQNVVDHSSHIFTISAKTPKALQDLVNLYKTYLDSNIDSSLADICYTTNVGRAHFSHRLAFVGSSCQELSEKLERQAVVTDIPGKNENPKIAFLFTGQGSQYGGMGKQLYKTHSVFRQALNQCEEILKCEFGVSLLNILLTGSEESELENTVYSQTCIFCIEYALCQLWKSFGVKPDCVLGHSLGEFAAATVAGVLSLRDALKLVYMRSKLLQSLPEGGMMAIMGNLHKVKNLVHNFNSSSPGLWLDVAVINSDEEIVVAGRPNSLEIFESVCQQHNLKTKRLAASQAFHSRDVDLILGEYRNVASFAKYNNYNCKYISGTSGELLSEKISTTYWLNHAKSTVNFDRAIKTLYQENCTVLIEIGPHPVLLALALANIPLEESSSVIGLPSMRKGEDNWVTILDSLRKLYVNGFDIDWDKFHLPFLGIRNKISLPTYPFQRQSYWFDANEYSSSICSSKKVLHPLIGRKIPLLTSEHIYHQTLRLQNVQFVEHHKIAERIIMPGACFLEMVLTAGFATISQCEKDCLPEPMIPLLVENFSIEAPLELKEEQSIDIQTMVIRSEAKESSALEFAVSVHRKTEKGMLSDWKRHAVGTFSMFSSFIDEKHVNISEIQSRCQLSDSANLLYDEFSKIGIAFGSLFRSISKVWKNDNETLAEIPVPTGAGKLENYLCHPILIDALMQCSAFRSENNGKHLYLPVGVKKFVWFSKKICPLYFAHSKIVDGQVSSVRLYDDCGNILALMEGIQIVQSSISSFLKAVSTENRLPGMSTEVWVPYDKSPCKNFDLSKSLKPEDLLFKLKDTLQKLSNEETKMKSGLKGSDELFGLHVFKTLIEVGWNPYIGEILKVADFLTAYIIAPRFEKFVSRLFRILTEDGFLECDAHNCEQWKVIKIPSKQCLTEDYLNAMCLNIDFPQVTDMYKLFLPCGRLLSSVLQGKDSMLTVLFSSEDSSTKSIAERLYSDTHLMISANEVLQNVVKEVTEDILLGQREGVFKVLEIGAGTGSTTQYVLNALETSGIPFEYTFSDISQVLLSKASKKFEKYGNSIQYKVLDIEKDPKNEGFVPFSFDLIVASNVIHATEDLVTSIRNVRHLLAPNGYLMLVEMLQDLRAMTLIFGSIDGFLRFKDSNIRTDSPLVSANIWESIMLKNGFQCTSTLHTSGTRAGIIVGKANGEYLEYSNSAADIAIKPIQNTWIVFSNSDPFSHLVCENLRKLGKTVSIVKRSSESSTGVSDYCLDPTNKETFDKMFQTVNSRKNMKLEGIIYIWGTHEKDEEQGVLQGLLFLAQNILTCKFETLPKLFVFTQGAQLVSDKDVIINPGAGSLFGFINTLKNEQLNLQCFCIDLDPCVPISRGELNSLLWGSHAYNIIAVRNSTFYSPRAKHFTTPLPLKFPDCPRFKIALPQSNSISDLTICPSERLPLLDTQIEIEVKATGLNFRDILIIMKPDGYSSFFDTEIGTDFSGVVVTVGSKVSKLKPGDEIFGASFRGSLSSHAIVQSELSCMKPKFITFPEAATLPSVYYTAYHCLINIAKLKKGDTILIHVASGGVGLIALQLAQEIGAKIVATAGSRRKRAYLRLQGVQHVFHSRDTSFADEIGKRCANGVDVVLNSLTSPGFKEATLRVCNRNARFVEIGKINIWQPEDVRKIREDVDYSIVNLENLSLDIMSIMVQKLETGLANGRIKPLPFTRFEMSNIREALNYFRKASHIGKIVVAIPECRFTKGGFEFHENIFNPQSTYLITGGLGGIGLEVAKWMSKFGAKTIVLVNRRPPDAVAQKNLDLLIAEGVNVIAKQVDVGDFSQCENLLKYCSENLPPLRGIMHAAGTLSDATIVNQNWSKFESVFNAKVKGSWNLHLLTQKYPLEHFVLYSSVAAICGSLGQSNHSAANYFMNTLANYRHSLGLPAQTINWGAWSDVGAAVASHFADSVFGSLYFSPSQGIEALRDTLLSHRVQTMVSNFESTLIKNTSTIFGEYIKEILVTNTTDGEDKNSRIDSKAFWESLNDLTLEDRKPIVQSHIEVIVREILKLPDSDKIDHFENFSNLGMDSLMAVELKNKLQLLMGKHISLNATAMLDYPNVNSLGDYLTSLTMQDPHNVPPIVSETKNDMDLVKMDSVLPPHIASISRNQKSPSDFRTILLTGSTGNLGIYVLRNLFHCKNLKIYCLVRHKSESGARDRIIATLQNHNLLEDAFSGNLQNIVFLPGDITKEYFGLEKALYDKLATRVDAIFHLASKINHLESYKNHKENKYDDIRSVNVLGLLRILEFACASTDKHLFYPTSFSAIRNTSNNLSAEKKPESIKLGFGLTKLVAESLIQQAIDRGINCTIFRLCSLVGSSETGHFVSERNHIATFFMACMKLGIYPKSITGFHILPVDTAAELFVKLSLNDKITSGMHNICNPKLLTRKDVLALCSKYGVPLKLVTSEEFSNVFHKNLANTVFKTFTDLYPSVDDFLAIFTIDADCSLAPGTSLYLEENDQSNRIFQEYQKSVSLLIPNFYQLVPSPVDTLKRHFEYAIKSNVLNLNDLMSVVQNQ